MDDINDYMFVFYWRNPEDKYDESNKEWHISQPVSMGELIDGGVEFNFHDGGSLPINDIDWSTDELKVAQVPPRKYKHTDGTDLPTERYELPPGELEAQKNQNTKKDHPHA